MSLPSFSLCTQKICNLSNKISHLPFLNILPTTFIYFYQFIHKFMFSLGGDPRHPPPPLDATGQPVVFFYGDANVKNCTNKSKVKLQNIVLILSKWFQ